MSRVLHWYVDDVLIAGSVCCALGLQLAVSLYTMHQDSSAVPVGRAGNFAFSQVMSCNMMLGTGSLQKCCRHLCEAILACFDHSPYKKCIPYTVVDHHL